MNKNIIEVSSLPKTWILDLDGTIFQHNGYKIDGQDSLLEDINTLLNQIKDDDMVIFITSRNFSLQDITEKMLRDNGIRYDHIIYNAPYGERIIINDKKPSGLKTALSINTTRNVACDINFLVNMNL